MFDEQISVETFGKYKPEIEVYSNAAKQLNVQEQDCMLVAVHDWDVYGALSAGLLAIFIKRNEQNPYFLPHSSTLTVKNLLELAGRL